MGVAEKPTFFGLLPAEADSLLQEWGLPPFAGRQLGDWVYDKFVADPSKMSNLSRLHRQIIADKMEILSGNVLRRQSSTDGTQKLLTSWDNGATAESVMIPDRDRRTACISSQVGCPVGCKFCASGIDGVKQNLTAARIVEQVFLLCLKPNRGGERISNVVFMGMGEPLANYANVIKAVKILHDPRAFNISARKITISTVGVPSKMRQLAHEELPLNLAISLHAPTEELRRQLIPWAEHFSLADILEAARYYFERTGREITLEYILLAGVNDQPQHARQLAALCKTLRANVNLIRYNQVEGLPFIRPDSQSVMRFQMILREKNVNAHVRKSRGRDIDAACGQLRRKEVESAGTSLPIPLH